MLLGASRVLADADIRPLLLSWLQTAHSVAGNEAIVIEELGICQGRVRVDIALVDGVLHGFEIKSELDSLRRLTGQIDLYSRVFDRVTLVAARRHLADALDIVPRWWGVVEIAVANGEVRFRMFRKGKRNPAPEARALVELLWRDDALELLDRRGLSRGLRRQTRDVIWDHVCQHLDIEEIAASVRDRLKARATSPTPPSPA